MNRLSGGNAAACGEFIEPCGGEIRVISFIEEDAVIEKILRHCGLWKEQIPRTPPTTPPPEVKDSVLDYGFFERTCA